jgi:hypothetical protein
MTGSNEVQVEVKGSRYQEAAGALQYFWVSHKRHSPLPACAGGEGGGCGRCLLMCSQAVSPFEHLVVKPCSQVVAELCLAYSVLCSLMSR